MKKNQLSSVRDVFTIPSIWKAIRKLQNTPPPPVGLTVIQVPNVAVGNTAWAAANGFYEKTISNANITAASVVDVIPVNASIAIVEVAILLPQVTVTEGAVKIYAYNVPTGTITVNLNIWK